MRNLSLTNKALIATLLALLPIVITFFGGYYKIDRQIEDDLFRELGLLTDTYSTKLFHYLEAQKQRSQDFATDGLLRGRLARIARGDLSATAGLNEHLIANKLTIDKSIRGIDLVLSDGKVVASTTKARIGKHLSVERVFSSEEFGASVVEGVYAGERGLLFYSPVTDFSKESLVGAVVNFVPFSELDRAFRDELTLDSDGFVSWKERKESKFSIYIVNSEKKVVASSGHHGGADVPALMDTEPIRKCAAAESTLGYYTGSNASLMIGGSNCVPYLGWTVLSETEAGKMLDSSKQLLKDAAFTGIFALGFISLFFVFSYRNVIRPLRAASDAATKLAGGDYSMRLPEGHGDEIGTLCASFNSMASEVQKRTRALEESHEKLKKAQRLASIGSFEFDLSSGETHWSEELCRILGTTREMPSGKDDLSMFVHPDDRDNVRKASAELLKYGTRGNMDFRILRPDGEYRHIHAEAYIERYEGGAPVKIYGIMQDITGRKESEKAVSESEERYRALFEDSKDTVFITSPEGSILDINTAGVEMLGYPSKAELMTVPISDIYRNPSDRDRLRKELEEHGFVKDFETEVLQKNGSAITVTLTATLVTDTSGNAIAFRGIARDITERRRLERKLLEAQKMEALGKLTGGIAHDFNNMLTGIAGFAYIMEARMTDQEPHKKYVRQILAISEKAAALTRGLLIFSNKGVFELKPLDLNELIESNGKLMGRIVGENINVTVKTHATPLPVMADEGQLEQMIANLILNAKDALAAGGRISLTASEQLLPDGGGSVKYAKLSIADTGCGMDEETRKRIFEPFFTTKEVGSGTGLGLSVAYGIVKEHKGHIEVESTVGKGTRFDIYLPVIKVEAMGGPGMISCAIPRGSETILVADDDDIVRKLLSDILEEFGYKILAACNGQEAVEAFTRHRDEISLVILDVVMPVKNGREAFEEIRKADPGIPAMFISGYTNNMLDKKTLSIKGVSFISKPIKPTEFLKKIATALAGEAC